MPSSPSAGGGPSPPDARRDGLAAGIPERLAGRWRLTGRLPGAERLLRRLPGRELPWDCGRCHSSRSSGRPGPGPAAPALSAISSPLARGGTRKLS